MTFGKYISKILILYKETQMTLNERIESFKKLGEILRQYPNKKTNKVDIILRAAARRAEVENPWFTQDQICKSLNAIGESLQDKKINTWLEPYIHRIKSSINSQTVGIVMAGNIPAVGFHDFLCVLISGNAMIGKLSSQDAQLLPALGSILNETNKEWESTISWTTDKLTSFDSLIATGNNNSARYFDYYFRNHPHLIRKNRTGIAIITGNESKAELDGIANDIMLYFGLGCRNVSKIFIPENYDFTRLLQALNVYSHYSQHNKYRNNYEFRKSCFLLNNISFIDSGFLLLIQSASLTSPVAVVNFEFYSRINEIQAFINKEMESIQCIVCNFNLPVPHVLPGMTQKPELWEYPDGVDTMDFLLPKYST